MHRVSAVVPAAVVAAAAGRTVRLVWQNEAGGLTYETGQGAGKCFIKWSPAASRIDLAAEAERMTWAAPFIADRWADIAVATWRLTDR